MRSISSMLRPSGRSFTTVTNDAVCIDQERTTQCNASVRMFDTVSLLDFAFDVRNHRVFHRTDAAVFDRVLRHALCTNSESKETPTTSTPRWNSS